ncbi:RNA polymerase I-specific transcription initiation factor RRN3-like isoform X1 [Carex littledalei]|uniref:RNA polymerase I-specific transcription initiation factor RRN3-like isoform X1 n=1 Tax=Carex littledalei TaxID=544730 RepID=A0A833RDP3_9POAL|nr:RNA polymerase I-specific transcription initiation factor RRN3-like isoform X1 [Carex littledalei]
MGAVTDEHMVEHEAAGEEGYDSDSEAFSSVHYVLDSVRKASFYFKAPSLVNDQYNYLLSIVHVDPSARFGPDEEALLTTALKAMARAVSRFDTSCHDSLLSNVFKMRIWFFGVNTRTALLELIITLAAVPDKYLEGCLHMLVSNFVPPDRVLWWLDEPKWVIRKREIHQELHTCLQYIFKYVPLAAFKLSDVLDKDHATAFWLEGCNNSVMQKMIAYVECMLGLQREEIEDVLSATLLSKVINLLSDLDVNITWNDVLQEDQTIGIFDMELEDLDNHCLQFAEEDSKVGFNSNNNSDFVEKLDGLMVVVCEHLKSRQDYDMFMDIFRTSVLKLHKSKFTQFVMFYACSLDPENWGLKFAFDLAEIFFFTSEDPISRMSAVSYLASYLSRAKFMSSSIVASFLTRLVNWCSDYCNPIWERIFNPAAHQIYYSACQAVMYILCFRMRELMDVPTKLPAKSFLFDLPLGSILCNRLDPLKVCLPSIVQEFRQQAKAARLFQASFTIDENAIDSVLSKAFGGTQRLDIFFPFDPYLLKESERFIRPNFVYWSRVKTTYSYCNSEEDDEEDEDEELQDLDAPRISSDPISSFKDHYDDDYNNSDGEGEDVEYSLNKMSITPKQTFNLHMPAKIRPSVNSLYC